MKKFLFAITAAALLVSSFGCSSSCGSQRRSWFSWWNRGDSCRTCTSDVVAEPGMLGSPIIGNVPNAPRGSSIEMLPGPLGGPVN